MLMLDAKGDWTTTYQVLQKMDLRRPHCDDNKTVPSKGRYEISWIWLTPHSRQEPGEPMGCATAGEFTETMHAEWAWAKAWVERWDEEEILLMEEMQWVLAYFEWKV